MKTGIKKTRMGLKRLFVLSLCTLAWLSVSAQTDDDTEIPPPGYNLTSDDPYDINKLFLHFQPFYADVSALNITGGFGVEANYYYRKVFDLTFSGRTSYGKRFDINRDAAIKNGINEIKPTPYYYMELGFSFHVMDRVRETISKVTLFDGGLSRSDWAATVPGKTGIDSKVRQILGVRVGASYSGTTTNLSKTLEVQGNEITFNDGTPIVADHLYTNINTILINIGLSMSWFHNFAVEFDAPWSPSGNDLLLTPYVDFLYAPYISMEDLLLQGATVSPDNVIINRYGFRAGLSGKFDRKIGWGYGAEVGLKPGLQKRGFFLTVKMSFPIFGLRLDKSQVLQDQSGE